MANLRLLLMIIGEELPILIIALFSARMIASPTISYPDEEENEQVDNNNKERNSVFLSNLSRQSA